MPLSDYGYAVDWLGAGIKRGGEALSKQFPGQSGRIGRWAGAMSRHPLATLGVMAAAPIVMPGSLGGAIGGAIGGGIQGGLLGAAGGAAYGGFMQGIGSLVGKGSSPMARAMVGARALKGAYWGAMAGAAYGYMKGTLTSNRAVNPINSLYT